MSLEGKKIPDLKQKITIAKQELSEIIKLEQPLPEFINTTNILRTNEYLSKANDKQSQLLKNYEDYSKQLEKLVLTISDVKTKLTKLKKRSKSRTKKKKLRKRVKKRTSRKSRRKIKRRK